MQSGRNLIVLLVGMVIFANGCKDKSNDEERLVKQISINFCEELLEKPNLPRETEKLVRKVLEMRNNSVIEAEPVMVRAQLVQPNRKDIVILGVGVSDENGDLTGIGIRERHFDSQTGKNVIEEEYPVFEHSKITAAGTRIFRVNLRNSTERKDEKLWEKYSDASIYREKRRRKEWDAGIYRREETPPIWISIPRQDEIEVEIWVYDHAGNISNAVPLENFLAVESNDK